MLAAALDDSAVCVMPGHATQQPLEVWFIAVTRSDLPLPVYDDIGSKRRERF